MSYYLFCFVRNGHLICFYSSCYDDDASCLFSINKFIYYYFDDERQFYQFDKYIDAFEFIESCGIHFFIVPRTSLNRFLKDVFN